LPNQNEKNKNIFLKHQKPAVNHEEKIYPALSGWYVPCLPEKAAGFSPAVLEVLRLRVACPLFLYIKKRLDN
jgi:hypothetical protein